MLREEIITRLKNNQKIKKMGSSGKSERPNKKCMWVTRKDTRACGVNEGMVWDRGRVITIAYPTCVR